MRNTILLIAYFGFSLSLYSTDQTPDRLIKGRDTIWLYSSPLEVFPELERRLLDEATEISSDCWKGYYAEWELLNDSLFLNSIYSCNTNQKLNSHAANILGRTFKNGRIHADWINDSFFGGTGRYDFFYSKEFLWSFDNGILRSTIEYGQLHNESELNDLKNIQEYIYENLSWSQFESEIVASPYVVKVTVIVDDHGEFKSANFRYGKNDNINRSILELLEKRPYWRLYYSKGERLNYNKQFELRFTEPNSLVE